MSAPPHNIWSRERLRVQLMLAWENVRPGSISRTHQPLGRRRMPRGAPDRAYEGFLELPVPVVLAVLWVAGAVLEGLCIAALYEFATR